MTAASDRHPAQKVIVQNAVDEAVYFVDEVRYEYVSVVAPGEDIEDAQRIVFVCFTPLNGHDRGHEHRVPVERVIAVISDA